MPHTDPLNHARRAVQGKHPDGFPIKDASAQATAYAYALIDLCEQQREANASLHRLEAAASRLADAVERHAAAQEQRNADITSQQQKPPRGRLRTLLAKCRYSDRWVTREKVPLLLLLGFWALIGLAAINELITKLTS